VTNKYADVMPSKEDGTHVIAIGSRFVNYSGTREQAESIAQEINDATKIRLCLADLADAVRLVGILGCVIDCVDSESLSPVIASAKIRMRRILFGEQSK